MKSINYQSPEILRDITLQTGGDILQSSLVDTATVRSVGQEVEEHDFTSGEFNHQWEE